MPGRDGVELSEHSLLDLHALRDRFDHEVDLTEALIGRGTDDAAVVHALQAADLRREDAHGHAARHRVDGLEAVVIPVLEAVLGDHGAPLR